ncbi:ABC transporter permease [Alteribacillus iranensis]|uniref:Peptide/nickel transport system permease protein n=1 Tax=Alteribacillus iranensis TaxID=930128 RepID=A0A1I2BDI1_9BACI|nr:ABC transporter permease [Alteribacillus iranensis]SFE54224.1 peptide/nickel transport system permease protein [Alteribacillus iranensis]
MKKAPALSIRVKTILRMMLSGLILVGVVVGGLLIGEGRPSVDLLNRNTPPSLNHLFGTDWLGRDLLARTLRGLTMSIMIGVISVTISATIAFLLSIISSWGRFLDICVNWFIDMFLSVPHIVILLLISFALGGGVKGVIAGLALTHWPILTRLLRAEVMQIKESEYVSLSRQLGKSRLFISRRHILPHIIPQLFVGWLLLFPHVILHESAITFLGFGLPAEQPSIGIILSESMQYLTAGLWWLAFFPGLALLLVVLSYDLLGNSIRTFIDPYQVRK